MTRIVGQEQIAEVFGVAPKTIVEWQEAGFPIALRGSPGIPSEYESQPCINWLVDREVKKVQAETPRDRLFRLQADALELDAAEKKGVLVRADSIEPRLRAAVVSAREFLLRLAGPLAAQMDGADRKKREVVLREAFDAFLRKLANWRNAEDDAEHDNA
ncbi:MAG: terminase small subunit [Rhizobacter sp.]